ncbi:MAG: IPT/TIG domain-containing protein, partial [Blastocatellia bacterium]
MRISLFILAIIALSLGALGLGLASIQASTKSAHAQTREVRVIGGDAFAGQTTSVSVELVSQGDENTVTLSLNFDPAIFSDPVVSLGSGATGSALGFNAGQAASGRLGITVTLPAGQAFAAGTQQLATVILTVAATAPVGPSPISFGDAPVARGISDVSAGALTAAYISGSINVIQPNPVPMLIGLSPFSAASGSPGFTLNVNGSSFVEGARVRWNGNLRTTTFVSSTKLAAIIPASDIVNPGTAAVTVVNPAPGGGLSNGALTFTITNGAPTITGVTPNSATAGSSDVTITVSGTGFLAASKVRFNSAELATVFVSDTQLTATVPASSLTAGGTASVTAVNPAPGGGTSNPATFTINSQVPVITNLSPGFAIVGGQQFTLTVNGTGFASNSAVRWNDSD